MPRPYTSPRIVKSPGPLRGRDGNCSARRAAAVSLAGKRLSGARRRWRALARVDRLARDQRLVVQVRPRRVAGRSRQADLRTGRNSLVSPDADLREMTVEAVDLPAVIDDDRPPVPGSPAGEGHGPGDG